jgi:hypothetical protein
LIRPWIIRQGALHPLQSWRGGLARGRHVGLSASSREGTPLKAAPIVVCARTSLAVTLVDDAQTSAMRARYGLTPRRVAGSRLAAHERARRPRAARTACRRRSLDVARMKAGDACASLQVPRLRRWQRSRQQVARWFPSFRRGTREKARARTSRSSRYPAVAPDASIPRRALDRYVA